MCIVSNENTWLFLPRTSCFCTYINNLPKPINSQCKSILFADDSSISISNGEIDYFQNCMNNVFTSLSKWFKADKLTLNFDKTNLVKLSTKSKTCINVYIWFDNKTTEEVETTKFLDLWIDNNLNWKTYIEYIIPKLSSACFGMMTHHSWKCKLPSRLHWLLPFHHVIWEIQQKANKDIVSKRKALE
jgi:hypothetical protein